MTAHHWEPDGLDLDGHCVRRCRRCGCRSSWPIAAMSCCGGVRTTEERAAHKRRQRAKRRALTGGHGGNGSGGRPTTGTGSRGRVEVEGEAAE